VPALHPVYHCTQCGGNAFGPAAAAGHVRCAYCGSEYEVVQHRTRVEADEPRIVVRGAVVVGGDVDLGADVHVADGGRLTVEAAGDLRVTGDVHVDPGATLALAGDLRLVRPAPEEAVRKALRRVERGPDG